MRFRNVNGSLIKHLSCFRLTVAILVLICFALLGGIRFRRSRGVIKTSPVYSVHDQSSTCTWVFDHYSPSPWESFWYDKISDLQNRVCSTLGQADQMNRTVQALEKVILFQKSLATNTIFTSEDDLLFSKMFYRYECSNEASPTPIKVAQYIEPLVGLTRDPVTICCHQSVPSHLVLSGEAALQSKRFFLLGPSAPYTNYPGQNKPSIAPWLHRTGARTILFDIGASLYNGQDHPTEAGTAIGARWFVDYFRSLSLAFDHLVAYERGEKSPEKYWEQIPEDIMGRLVFINHPVALSGKFHPWTVLRSLAKKEDYVIVKLDIDTPDLENALLAQVINDTSISSLIDEMFFEMHVNVNEMRTYWGLMPGELKDTYVVFTQLRRLGIRMHSWP